MRTKAAIIAVLCLALAACSSVAYQADPSKNAHVTVSPYLVDGSCEGSGFSFLAFVSQSGAVRKAHRAEFYLKPGKYTLHFDYLQVTKSEKNKCTFLSLTPIITHTRFGVPAVNIEVSAGQQYVLNYVHDTAVLNAL
jgi:hypothetical protein